MDLRSRSRAAWLDRALGTPRLVLAVLLLSGGALVALTAAGPVRTRPVLVAVRDLPAGAVVAAADVTLAARPAGVLPAGSLTAPTGAVGHHTVGALRQGEIVTDVRLAPAGLAAGLGAGRAVATVTVGAAQASTVAVGDVVDVVTAGPGGASGGDAAGLGADDGSGAGAAARASPLTVAEHARVLAVWPPGQTWGTAATQGTTLALEVDVQSASRLAVMVQDDFVGVVVVTE